MILLIFIFRWHNINVGAGNDDKEGERAGYEVKERNPNYMYFVRTQSTEASPTYVATSPIACSYFVFPLISHQIWCFSIPNCYDAAVDQALESSYRGSLC